MRKTNVILCIIILSAMLLRFVPAFHTELYSDNAHYSFRALGLFDDLGPTYQTGPFRWFGTIPWWGYLSFQDAPPLVFFAQHIFFVALGDTTFVAVLPFALAGVFMTYLLSLFLSRLKGKRVAIIASGIFALSSFAVWSSLSGFLEGIEVLFITLTFFFFAQYLVTFRSRELYLTALFLGLSLISKYTSIFLVPALLFAFLFFKYTKKDFDKRIRNISWKEIVIASAVVFTVLLPVITYNIQVYRYRGHLDSALSAMVGMTSKIDFGQIADRSAGFHAISNYKTFVVTLFNTSSAPLAIMFLLSLIWLVTKWIKKKTDRFEIWLLISLVALMLMFAFLKPETHYLSIISPFIAISLGIGISDALSFFEEKRTLRFAGTALLGAIVLYELFYSINTNILTHPIGTISLTYSAERESSLGFNNLDSYLRSGIVDISTKRSVESKSDFQFTNKDVLGKHVVIYDDRINWFAHQWYFERYLTYYKAPVISTSYLVNTPIHDLFSASGQDMYFIYPVDPSVLEPGRENDASINTVGPQLKEYLEKQKTPSITITNFDNKPVFTVYRIENI
jgi:hypothetical protein